jgi:hypothetical protein
MIISELLWFLKCKDKDGMNELSTYLVFTFLTFGIIALSKGSVNLSVETNFLFESSFSIFNNWEVINIPIVLIPCLTILLLTEQRVITARKKLYLKTFDGYFDVVTEKLIFFYLALLMIKAIFGGVSDLSFVGIESEIPYMKVFVLTYKYIFISLIVHFCLRFKSLSKNIKVRRQVSFATITVIFINLAMVFYFRHILG